MEEMELIFSWLPPEARQIYIDAMLELDDADAAWAVVRADTRYEEWFPGNLTEDGRPRYSEATYATVVAAYDDTFRAVGLNPALFQSRYGELISGEVSPKELEELRIMPVYERIIEGSEYIKAWYSDNMGIEMTTEAILASALDPSLGNQILNREIGMAEIAGEAVESGFDAEAFVPFLEQLYTTEGMDRQMADRLFSAASDVIPALSVLARRHADPDDTFDLGEFVSAELWSDPFQRRRMRRLVSQERAAFGGQGQQVASDQRTGVLSGLEVL